MPILSMTTWENIVGFCTAIFSMLHKFFNESLLADFLKTRTFAGYSFSYGSLIFGGLITAMLWTKVRDIIIKLVLPI